MRRLGVLATAAGAAILVLPAASAQQSQEEAPKTRLRANMTAEEVVPQPGPKGENGSVELSYVAAEATLCYDFSLRGLDQPPTGAHVHEGGPGVAGPVVIDLRFTAHGEEGCVPVDAARMNQVLADPPNHYVNVTTRDHPRGAIRGQLELKD